MTDHRQVMQQALDALNGLIGEMTVGQRYTNEGEDALNALAALRDALNVPEANCGNIAAAPQAEPVDHPAPAADVLPALPDGWRFFSAEDSIEGRTRVLLQRVEQDVQAWHRLPDEVKAADDGPTIYAQGRGRTLIEAMTNAADAARKEGPLPDAAMKGADHG